MKHFKLLIILNLIWFLFSCGTVKKGFENQKKNNSDEFLVEKKSPLVMPPDYNDLPIPSTNQEQTQKSDNKIKSLITNEQNRSSDLTDNETNKNFEETLIEKIKSN